MISQKLVVVLILATTVLGCAAKYSPIATEGFAPNFDEYSRVVVESSDRAVVRSSNLDLRVKDVAALKSEVEQLIEEAEGLVEQWSLIDDRSLGMTLRVPEAKLDAVMDRIADLGRVKRRSLNSQDVTEQLIDLEARLRNLVALRDRLRTYLKQASDLKEILEVERELVRVQTEIEKIEARLKSLRNRVAMATLVLTARKQGRFF